MVDFKRSPEKVSIVNNYLYSNIISGALTVAVNFYRNIDFMSSLQIPKMRIPTLIIWGTENKFLDKELAKLYVYFCFVKMK